ncbi:GAF and ANTAR domain-containing protein [Streptomyces sp. NPDC087300]|uniref:GAF and ANTAR domain-containing protein n=1 Tax=Streptomyces sp. NPDC087300 TaxID=3365780 RepID=UPI0038295BA5
MNPQGYEEGLGLAVTAQRRAALAMERARRAEEVAERHELLALASDPGVVGDEPGAGSGLHAKIAERYRRTATCHRSSAELQEVYARRAERWAAGHGLQPRFMTGVAEACGMESAALALVDAGQNQLAVAVSDEPARAAQDLEFVLGEGPCRDAAAALRPVHASGTAIQTRWPGYGPALRSLGIVTVSAVPLHAQDSCVGSLAVFDPRPRHTDTAALTDIADALTRIVALGPDADPELYGDTDHRDTVQQAVGMVSARTGCSVADALALIKARAFTTEVPTEAVARLVLRGDLDFG